jgi:hypothetical protein
MQDRPIRVELLGGIGRFLESELVLVLEEPLRFHTRVAANQLRIIERETVLEREHLNREAEGLRRLLSAATPQGEVFNTERLREEV